MKKILIPLMIIALACFCATASAEGNVLKFVPNAVTLFEGETLKTELNRAGAPAGGELTYSSAREAVATVDQNGTITGVSKGKTTVVATVMADGRTYRAQMTVTVARKAESVEVQTGKLPLYNAADPLIAGLVRPDGEDLPVLVIPVKKNIVLQASVLPKDATNRNIVLASEDESVLRARGNSVTGVAAGETVLTVANQASPEVNVRYRVLVVQPVFRISVDASAPAVAAGEQVTVRAAVMPEDASIPQVAWSSADESIATVSADGTVTGIRRGNTRLTASATDGSGVRASFSIKVVQKPEEIQLDRTELTVDVGRNIMLKATVLPKNTDDKKVVWTSTDENVAKVNPQGRVTGVALGSCRIICTSAVSGEVQATAEVTVRQPVTGITFDEPAKPVIIFLGETGKVHWTVKPEDASNPEVVLSSSNEKILTVAADGTVTPVKVGEADVNAVSADGSNRRARIRIRVVQHVEGVSMKRKTAYIDRGSSSTTSAVIEPKNAYDKAMTWESADPSIATVSGKDPKIRINGVSNGETVITGTTHDGGFQATIAVKVGDWEKALKIAKVDKVNDPVPEVYIRNDSELSVTKITVEVTCTLENGDPVPCNEDGSNTYRLVWKGTLENGETTKVRDWKPSGFKTPEFAPDWLEIKIVEFQIDHDWVKVIRKNHQPTKKIQIQK